MPFPPTLLAFVLAVTTAVRAQAPAPEELARKANELVQQLEELADVDGPTDAQKAQLAGKQQELAEFVSLCTKGDGFAEQHFVAAGGPLVPGHQAEALAVSEAGIARFPESRFLHDHVGYAHSALAFEMHPCAAQLSALKLAEKAFRKALQCQPNTWHAHAGLCQVLDHLGTCDEALRELDIVMKDGDGAAATPSAWLRRASLLMRSGKSKDAIAVLKGVAPPDDQKVDAFVLRLRATALAKDVAATTAAANELRALEDSPRTLVEIADALATSGKKDDALKLLGKRPARSSFATDEERIAQQHLQAAAALELVLKTNDWSPKGPAREALTKALGHTFAIFDASAKPPQTDISSSPLAMAHLLVNKPATPPKDCSNRILLLLCLRAMPGHTPSQLESMALGTQSVKPDAADIPALLTAARFDVGDPEQAGALTGRRVLEELAAATAPAKK